MPAIDGHFDVPQEQPVSEVDQQLNTLTNSYEFRLNIVQAAATLQHLGHQPHLEGRPCTKPSLA